MTCSLASTLSLPSHLLITESGGLYLLSMQHAAEALGSDAQFSQAPVVQADTTTMQLRGAYVLYRVSAQTNASNVVEVL